MPGFFDHGGWLDRTFNGVNTPGQQAPNAFGGGTFRVDPSQFQLPGFNQYQQQSQQYANQAMGGSPLSPYAEQNQQLSSMLMRAANGDGPSAAQSMLQQQTQNNVANAYAMAQTRPNDAGGARNIANQAVSANQQANGQAATLRAQEQQAAQSQLGNLLGQQGNQAIAGFQAQNQAGQGWTGLGLGASQAQLGANEAAQQLQQGSYYNSAGINNKAQGQVIGGITGGVSSALGAGMHAHGGLIPGHPAAPGDSYANDTVPAKLSPGEVVLPRSVTQSEDAPEKAKAFMAAILKKHGRGKKK